MRLDKSEILEFVREKILAGENINDIARDTPVSHTTIRRWLKGERHQSPTVIQRLDERARVNALRSEGVKLTDIAKGLDLSLRTVNRHVSKATKTARRVERETNQRWVIEQFHRGLSRKQISDLPDCPVDRETLTRWIREHHKERGQNDKA